MAAEGTTGVVLLNMGGPDSLDAVEPFLYNLFRDNDLITLPWKGLGLQRLFAKLVSSRRAKFVRGYYGRIGGKSPIADITREQARLVEERLNTSAGENVSDHSHSYRCYVAMRYWHPFTDEALAAAKKDGVTRVVALSLYPHYTTATTGSSLNELRRGLRRAGLDDLPRLEVDRFFDAPLYLDALAAQVAAGLDGFPEERRAGVTLLFSAHGLPNSFIRKGDPYVEHLLRTIVGVMARLALETGRLQPWRLSYQSRVGKDWLTPGTEDVLAELARTGHKDVLAVPISFVCDHIETLYEIDLLFGEEAQKLGLDFRRAPSLNTDPTFIDALATLVRERVAAPAEPR